MSLGISMERIEQMTETERLTWLIALREVNGEKFDWRRGKFVERKKGEE